MRISDWSSDVCSSDLEIWLPEAGGMLQGMARTLRDAEVESFEFMRIVSDGGSTSFHAQPNGAPPTVFTMVASGEGRAEERRVGKECVSTCGSRGSPAT